MIRYIFALHIIVAQVQCSICLGERRVHLPRCQVNIDAEVTCNCGLRGCPACNGTGFSDPKRAEDHTVLLDRAAHLMRNPLTSDERAYVLGLSQRLGGGHKPMLADWFRSLELVEKYNPKSKSKAAAKLASNY